MSAETDIAAINDGGVNTASEVRTAFTSVLARADNTLAPPSSPHADDDEFDDGTKTGITETTVTGNCTWTESKGVLSAKFSSQSANDVAVALKSLTPTSPPVTIETAVRFLARHETNPMFGIGFTDGTSSTANLAALMVAVNDTLGLWIIGKSYGTLTNVTVPSDITDPALLGNRLWLRCVWTATNTFEIVLSPDGVSWTKFALSDLSKTMTPTHFGLIVSSWSTTFESVATFDYIRVTETDLSV